MMVATVEQTNEPPALLNLPEFTSINDNVSKIQTELQNMISCIKDMSAENQEFKSTFEMASKEFDSFKKSTNFRLSLYQSKEQKFID